MRPLFVALNTAIFFSSQLSYHLRIIVADVVVCLAAIRFGCELKRDLEKLLAGLTNMVEQTKTTIKIASDCSGVGTDAFAAAELGLTFRSVFASEIDASCRQVLRNHCDQPERILKAAGIGDKVSHDIDLYTVGMPCQPYSSAGKRQGRLDKRCLAPSSQTPRQLKFVFV